MNNLERDAKELDDWLDRAQEKFREQGHQGVQQASYVRGAIAPGLGVLGGAMRQFETGATRNSDADRYDPEGFLSPLVIERYCEYMNKNRVQADGSVRASDNWQKGIPKETYIKGLWRHFLHLWTRHRGFKVVDPKAAVNIEEDLCAIIFGASGYLFELLKVKDGKSESK